MGRGRRAGWGTMAPLLYILFIDSLLEHLFSDLKNGEQPVTSRQAQGTPNRSHPSEQQSRSRGSHSLGGQLGPSHLLTPSLHTLSVRPGQVRPKQNDTLATWPPPATRTDGEVREAK